MASKGKAVGNLVKWGVKYGPHVVADLRARHRVVDPPPGLLPGGRGDLGLGDALPHVVTAEGVGERRVTHGRRLGVRD